MQSSILRVLITVIKVGKNKGERREMTACMKTIKNNRLKQVTNSVCVVRLYQCSVVVVSHRHLSSCPASKQANPGPGTHVKPHFVLLFYSSV